MNQNMRGKLWRIVAAVSLLAIVTLWAGPAVAQTADSKEKPPMYTYVGNWNIPRGQWAEMEKANAGDQPILQKALTDGTLVGYGNDQTLVHQPEGSTHDEWWSATTMAGLLKVLEQFYKNGSSTSPVLASATKHWDHIFVSRHYNWHSGSWKDVYTHASSYKLKPHAPDDAIETLSKNLFVPLLEKLLADGAIHEYEIDTEAIHTDSPGSFYIFYIAANAEGLDKASAAVREAMRTNPLGGEAFTSMVDFSAHRDDLLRTTAAYK
jgi:hypothetical protein